jgi:orotidine-5'-phosphate decarboxylase
MAKQIFYDKKTQDIPQSIISLTEAALAAVDAFCKAFSCHLSLRLSAPQQFWKPRVLVRRLPSAGNS